MKIKKQMQFLNGLEFSTESNLLNESVVLIVRSDPDGSRADPVIEVRMSGEEAKTLGMFIRDAGYGN